MMIVNWLTYYVKPGQRELFCAELEKSGYLGKCRNHTLWYELFLPIDGSDRVIVYQGWEDRAAIDAHRKESYMDDFRAIKAYYVTDQKSEAFEADELEIFA